MKDPLLRPNEHHDRRVPGIFTHTGGTYEFGAWLRNNKDVSQTLGITTIHRYKSYRYTYEILLSFEGLVSSLLEIRK